MKIALVASVGGHLTELLAVREAVEGHELVWIINDVSPVLPVGARGYRVVHAERDLHVLTNLVEFAAIFAREAPDVMLSTGAGPAVPAAVVARLLGIPVVYIESVASVARLSLTGRLMRFLASEFLVQWPHLAAVAPWARYEGAVL